MTRPIVAGYCPRTTDRAPVEFAVATGRATRAPVLVVGVHAGGTPADTLTGGELAELSAEKARAALEPLRDELDESVEVRAREASTPAAGLTAVAEEVDARLLVLGSTARGVIGRVLPGSTAERVVHGAPCPVAVVPRGYTVPERGIATVGAAFAPTEEGRAALGAAARLAAATGARLRVIMVLDPKLAERDSAGMLAVAHHEHDSAEDRAGQSRMAAERAFEVAIAGLPPSVLVDRDILFQDPADGLASASNHVDVLVMGSRGYGPMRAVMLGGVSRRVIDRAACPVLVLPRGAGDAVDALVTPAMDERAAR